MSILARFVRRLRGPRADATGAVDDLRRRAAEALARDERDTALALCDEILKLAPDDAQALIGAAIIRLKRGELARAASHYARIEERSSAGARTARLLRESFMDPARAARGEPYVAALDDVLVETSYWAVIDGEKIYTRETQARTVSNSAFVRGRVSTDQQHCIATLPVAPQRIEEPCILLGSDGNYAHWTLRNLLKLSLLEHADIPRDARYLVREDLRRWQKEYLDLLGIPEARLLRVPDDAVVACRRLHVPTQLRKHPRMADGIAWLRAKLAAHLAPAREATALVYASRREQANRRMLNEAELEAALATLGFEIIVPGEMRVRDQIAAFSRARVVVAPHGAATANMLFAPPGATLLELVSAKILHMDEIRILCAAAGQHTRSVVAQEVASAPRAAAEPEMHLDYRVDIDAVLATVRELVGRR